MNLISSYVCLKGQLGVAQLESEVKTKTIGKSQLNEFSQKPNCDGPCLLIYT